MKLAELFASLELQKPLPPATLEREVQGIFYDSRKVKQGCVFVAVRGFHSDGHQFIAQAIKQGAAAVVAEHEQGPDAEAGVPVALVKDSRRALAQLADAFYGHPSKKLKLVGITGTNGKTTTTYLVKSIIEASGRTAGLIGTIDYRVGDRIYAAPNTTPESLDLQRLLSEMVEFGATHCVMEVSSHALVLGRVVGCRFAAAGFTNLTQDHLDFHKTMDEYLQAKLLLFKGLSPDAAIIVNTDDKNADAVIKAAKGKTITTGLSEHADIHPCGKVHYGIAGLSFDAATPNGRIALESPLIGRHNVYNILTAIGIGTALGFSKNSIIQGIKNMKAVPGRMEKIDEAQPYGVIVDYAHTEDALLRLLESVGEIAKKRIITVFGCGGDRDRTKRPKMGTAALKGSDIVIVTSDNPRTENPLDIIREIEAGMTGEGKKTALQETGSCEPGDKKPYYVIPDRGEAVAAAIRMALPEDVVVIAGKGHEDYQIIGEKKMHFDDREVARAEIQKKKAS